MQTFISKYQRCHSRVTQKFCKMNKIKKKCIHLGNNTLKWVENNWDSRNLNWKNTKMQKFGLKNILNCDKFWKVASQKYVTWSRGMSRMSWKLIWVTGYRRWKILMFYTVFELHRIGYISATRCPIEMGFGCSIYGQVVYNEKSKLNIANMWLTPLDHVTKKQLGSSGVHICGICVLSWHDQMEKVVRLLKTLYSDNHD